MRTIKNHRSELKMEENIDTLEYHDFTFRDTVSIFKFSSHSKAFVVLKPFAAR